MTRYEYSCADCGGSVTKEPCRTVKAQAKKGETATSGQYFGLGGWRCVKDGSVSVKRKNITEQT